MKTSHRPSRHVSRSLLSCALASVLLLGAPELLAQSTGATLRGQVSAQAAPSAGARVTATNVNTGLSRSVQTSANGSYSLGGLPPGTYRVDVVADGQARSETVVLQVGQTATLDLGLDVAAAGAPATDAADLDAVVVTGSRLVETMTSEIATYVTPRQIEALPQASRNFLAFADTVPGMVFTTGNESRLRSGAQGASNINVYIDGVGQKNYVTPGGITGQDDSRGNPFPQMAIGEYKVITSNYKAEYDQISSAAVTAVTRSGTNDFTGSFFWDRFGDDWRAATPREQADGRKSPERTEQYGVSLGGPILRDRLHFFLTYEAKDFVVPESVFPPAQVDPAVLPPELRAYYGPTSRPFNQDSYFGKLSLQATDNHLLEFTARHRDEVGILGTGGSTAASAATALNNNDTRFDLRSLYTADTWMNDAHITYERAAYNPEPVNPQPSRRYTITDPQNPTNPNLPILTIDGGGTFQDKGQRGIGLQNDFTFTGWEGHTIKAGVKFKQVDLQAFQQSPPFPRYWYAVEESLDQPYRIEFNAPRVGRDPFVESRNRQFGIYIQDDWEVNDRLILNLGLRWDYEDNPSFTDYRLAPEAEAALRGWSNLDNADYDIGQYINTGNRRNDRGAIQPRLGFSYDLSGDQRHVIFGGAGRAYDRNLFDYMAREYYAGAFGNYTLNFSTDLHPCDVDAANCIAFDPALLTEEGLRNYVQANPIGGGDITLLNNDLKTPYSDQFSLGIRNAFELWGNDWNSSVTLSHIRSHDGIVFRLGNRRPDGSFHEFEDRGQTWGGQPWGSNFPVPGYGQLVLADNGIEYRLNSLLLSLDKPYSNASPWGVNLAYTYSDATENRPGASDGETYLFDYPFVTDQFYVSTGVPRHRLVLSGIYSPGWDMTFSGKLVLQSHTPNSATNCLDSLPEPEPSFLCRYDPYTPNGSIGFKQLDLAAEKRWHAGDNLSFRVRADLLNAFNWRNWTQFDGRYGLGDDGRGPANPALGDRADGGLEIALPTRTFKLSFGLDW